MQFQIPAETNASLRDQLLVLATEQMSSRTRKAKFSRLSRGISCLLGIKDEIRSLSITMDPAQVLITIETKTESLEKFEVPPT